MKNTKGRSALEGIPQRGDGEAEVSYNKYHGSGGKVEVPNKVFDGKV